MGKGIEPNYRKLWISPNIVWTNEKDNDHTIPFIKKENNEEYTISFANNDEYKDIKTTLKLYLKHYENELEKENQN